MLLINILSVNYIIFSKNFINLKIGANLLYHILSKYILYLLMSLSYDIFQIKLVALFLHLFQNWYVFIYLFTYQISKEILLLVLVLLFLNNSYGSWKVEHLILKRDRRLTLKGKSCQTK